MPRVMNKIRLFHIFHIMTSATFWFAIAEIAFAADQMSKEPPKELPNLTANHIIVILAVITLMILLFCLLFRWWQKMEQASYFGTRFQDTIKANEVSRLRFPIDAKWNQCTYLKEIYLGETERGERWVNDHPREEPGKTLMDLARELGYNCERVFQDIQRNMWIPEIGVRIGGRHLLPVSGDGFSNMDDPWETPDPSGGGNAIPGSDPRRTPSDEEKEKLKKFAEERCEFKNRADIWVRKAYAWAYQRYQEDLEEAKEEAENLAKKAMGAADFSAIRGRGPEFVLEFTAVVIIIFAAVILGIVGQLSNEQIGTLLASIAGYVLAKATTRGSSAQVQVVSDKTPEQNAGGTNQARSASTEGGNQGDSSAPKKDGKQVDSSAPTEGGNQGNASASKDDVPLIIVPETFYQSPVKN